MGDGCTNFMGAWHFLVLSAKFLLLGGGFWVLLEGGGVEVPILVLLAWGFFREKFGMRMNSLNGDRFEPFRSHRGLLGRVFWLHRFYRGLLQRDASMRALLVRQTKLLSERVSNSSTYQVLF